MTAWILTSPCQNLSDLGLPSNAYDGIFIPMNTGWSGDIGVMPEAW